MPRRTPVPRAADRPPKSAGAQSATARWSSSGRSLPRSDIGPSLITLYNLYPSATFIGRRRNYSSGQVDGPDGTDRQRGMPQDTGYEWTAMSYQEKIIGGLMY